MTAPWSFPLQSMHDVRLLATWLNQDRQLDLIIKCRLEPRTTTVLPENVSEMHDRIRQFLAAQIAAYRYDTDHDQDGSFIYLDIDFLETPDRDHIMELIKQALAAAGATCITRIGSDASGHQHQSAFGYDHLREPLFED